MASVKRRGTSWQATYRGPDGRERTKTFQRKVEAEGWVSDEQSALRHGSWIDPKAGKTTFGDFARSWQAAQVHRPATAANIGSALRKHILPTFEARPIASIRPSEIQTWVRGISGKLSSSSVRVVVANVRAIFNAAVRDQVIARSPCVGVKLPAVDRSKVQPLETAEVFALVKAVPDRYQALVIFAAGTGLRQGECFGLTLDRVDFLRRQVTVDRQLVLLAPRGRGPAFGPPKTQASYRVVPLPAVVLDALAAHLAAYPVGTDGFLFTSDAGEPIRRTGFSNIWRPAVKAAGAPNGTGFHALRHFYASLLIRHGESVKVVQARLGHASAAETLDTYSHLWPDSEDQTRAAVDEVLSYPADISRTSAASRA
ncbi:MAG TPA: tyrosine-type recombinase/integrase [Acidimicrobiales bacterium]|nr:tyrosine-type recombinase/integrase [Acidimicrobiales bacterium]